jgi:hypothetical protein
VLGIFLRSPRSRTKSLEISNRLFNFKSEISLYFVVSSLSVDALMRLMPASREGSQLQALAIRSRMFLMTFSQLRALSRLMRNTEESPGAFKILAVRSSLARIVSHRMRHSWTETCGPNSGGVVRK